MEQECIEKELVFDQCRDRILAKEELCTDEKRAAVQVVVDKLEEQWILGQQRLAHLHHRHALEMEGYTAEASMLRKRWEKALKQQHQQQQRSKSRLSQTFPPPSQKFSNKSSVFPSTGISPKSSHNHRPHPFVGSFRGGRPLSGVGSLGGGKGTAAEGSESFPGQFNWTFS